MKVAIVFGGISFEHEISIVSSIALKDVLKKDEIVYLNNNDHIKLIEEFYTDYREE